MTKKIAIHSLIKQKRDFYDGIVSVYCPILADSVYFTSGGFNHLLYKSNRQPRKISEKFMKLQCLTYAPQVIKECLTISETRKIEKRIKNKLKSGFHYELVSEVCKDKKIRVIVEKIGTGKHKFLSVMPHDRKSKKMRWSLNLDMSTSKKGLRPTSTKV